MRAPPVRRGRVLGMRGGHRYQAREPPFGHVQDGTDVGSEHGGRPGTPSDRCAQPQGDGCVRVSHRTELQSHRTCHNGGRERVGLGEANVERVRSRE